MYDPEQISILLVEKINDILDENGITYVDHGSRISMPCFIHAGDNPNGLGILKKDVGHWQCFTHGCHNTYGSSILDFLQQLLKLKSFPETINWAANYLGIKVEDYVPKKKNENDEFLKINKFLNRKVSTIGNFYLRSEIIKDLEIPSQYYLKRGFSEEVLRRFDIGDCYEQEKIMFYRTVVPCYNSNTSHAVGVIGRSVFEKCDLCGLYHDKSCPITSEKRSKCVKWRMSSNFPAEHYLFNQWNFNNNYDYVILTEGVGDVLRFEESGIPNSLSVFGSKLTSGQQFILETLPIVKLILAFDNDSAGRKIAEFVKHQCKRLFKIIDVIPTKKDFGETSVEEIKQLFRRFL